MRAGRVFGLEALEHVTTDNQRPVLALKPSRFDADEPLVDPIELYMGHVGRSPERRGAAGKTGGENKQPEFRSHAGWSGAEEALRSKRS